MVADSSPNEPEISRSSHSPEPNRCVYTDVFADFVEDYYRHIHRTF